MHLMISKLNILLSSFHEINKSITDWEVFLQCQKLLEQVKTLNMNPEFDISIV